MKKGEFKQAQARHQIQARNSENLRKLREGLEAEVELQVDGTRYRVRRAGDEYYPGLECVVSLRPGHWVVDMVVYKDGLRACESGKHIQLGDVIAEVVAKI